MPYLLQGSETFHEKKRRRDLLQDFKIDYRLARRPFTMNKKGKRKKTKKNENAGTSFLYHNAVTTLWGKKTCQQWLPSIKIYHPLMFFLNISHFNAQ